MRAEAEGADKFLLIARSFVIPAYAGTQRSQSGGDAELGPRVPRVREDKPRG